jgi:hypothetical protein
MRTTRATVASLLASVLLASAGAAAEKPAEFTKELRQAQSEHQGKRYRECVRACDNMLTVYKETSQVKEVTWLKIESLILDSQYEAALKTLGSLAEGVPGDKELQAAVALRTGDVQRLLKKLDAAVAEYERVIYSYPREQNACQDAQSRIVETYRAEGNWAEALGAARILYDAAASEEGIRKAAQTVAQAFLAADGNLGRANEFLSYQRFGPDGPDGKPKTEDDIAVNHLAQVKYPARSALANERFQAAVDAQPRNYEGYRAKGLLYIYWGKPKEGAAQFRLAFKAANFTQLPAASQELVLVGMKACTASFRGLDRIFEYILYGPKGKSGKENIPDPFAGL